MPKNTFLIIVAAGTGERMNAGIPKQYLKLKNKMILRHTMDVFADIKEIKQMVIVFNPKDEDNFQKAIAGYKLNGRNVEESIIMSNGGKTRRESVHNGLKALSSSENPEDEDIVLIHDAARPFVAHRDIDALLNVMKQYKGASLAYNITDTCRTVNKKNEFTNSVSRENLFGLQTPQAFLYGVIMDAHNRCDPLKKYTDDTAMVSDMGHDIALVPANKYNFKITTQEDMHMADQILSTMNTENIRTGMGYDVHSFDENAQAIKTIRLCGIDIDHDRKLKGHSDADVALHSICDAIYGAISEGDIGTHFPSNNPDYKNTDSAVFLEHAISLLREKGGKLLNTDITIICEEPKIGVHRKKMTERLAQIMNISEKRINIKATTTEKLGFAGRKEGIASQAVATVLLQENQEGKGPV